MKATSSQKIKIGLFTIIGTGALLLVIFFIGNQRGMFSPTYTISGTFKNVSGLLEGNNVRLAGINVGVVENIEMESDSAVRVSLSIKEKYRRFIQKSAKITIGSDGLMGDRLVTIRPGGSTNGGKAENGTALQTIDPIDGDKIMTRMSKVADNAERITSSLAIMFEKVNNGKGTLGKLINSDKLANDLEHTVAHAKTTVKTVNKASITLNEDLKAAQHNFLLRGFFKKKQQKRTQDSLKRIEKQKEKSDSKS